MFFPSFFLDFCFLGLKCVCVFLCTTCCISFISLIRLSILLCISGSLTILSDKPLNKLFISLFTLEWTTLILFSDLKGFSFKVDFQRTYNSDAGKKSWTHRNAFSFSHTNGGIRSVKLSAVVHDDTIKQQA